MRGASNMGSFYVNPVRVIVLWLKKLRKPNITRHETKKKTKKTMCLVSAIMYF